MKRFFIVFLALAMSFSLFGCSEKNEAKEPEKEETVKSEATDDVAKQEEPAVVVHPLSDTTMDNLDEEYRPDDMEVAMETFSQAMGVVFGVVCGAFVLPLLFAILGGLKKSAGLTIAALIFTAISQAILSGVLLLILSAVVYIVQIVLCNKYKKA